MVLSSVYNNIIKLSSFLLQWNHHHHHHHQSFMELGHLLTRSGLTLPEVSLTFYQYFFCQLGNVVS